MTCALRLLQLMRISERFSHRYGSMQSRLTQAQCLLCSRNRTTQGFLRGLSPKKLQLLKLCQVMITSRVPISTYHFQAFRRLVVNHKFLLSSLAKWELRFQQRPAFLAGKRGSSQRLQEEIAFVSDVHNQGICRIPVQFH